MILTTLVLTGALWSSVSQTFEPKEFPNLFEACEYRYSGGQYHDHLFRYRLFVPRNLRPGEQCPLLVWLHGKNESGEDNEWNLLQLPMIVNPSKSVEQYRFFVLAMQCPEADPTWSHGQDDAAGDMLAVTYEVLQKTLREQPVDQDRIYLSGVSSGGAGCWEMAMRHPDLFAAVAPMSSGGGDVSRVSKLVNIPIWAFHCLYDAPEGVEQTVAALREAGGNVHLTLLRSAIHDSWHDAFRGFGSFDWMLAQRRGAQFCWTPPGHRAWQWWHVFGVPGAFLAIVGLGWYSEQRRRRTRRGNIPKTQQQNACVPTLSVSNGAATPAESDAEQQQASP